MMSLEGFYKVLCTLGYVNYCLVNYCKSLVHVGSIILNANYYYYYYYFHFILCWLSIISVICLQA